MVKLYKVTKKVAIKEQNGGFCAVSPSRIGLFMLHLADFSLHLTMAVACFLPWL